ncbi:alpha/beta fold hydrolase [Pseudactinotalea suaedae]|uniref:alpha/beta fold hydrolase n=1 Tax=Pseudactinotalea suaedae TaxID=1524924 RepID=UPI0012E0C9D7|nr:alpha/beta hydrolase [Pseudactinotalea suaedae]
MSDHAQNYETETPETDSAEGPEAEVTRPRRRRWKVALVVAGAVVLVAAFALRSPSPVGHWRSAEGYDAHRLAYDEAMAEMPEAAATLDLRTDYGWVRMYRYAGENGGGDPLLLVTGHGAGSPVWAANLDQMLELGDVYTLDLLGHPGMSVQERPIVDAADQAMWLHQAIEQLPEDRFHVIGLSVGGWTAANLATRHPGSAASLTLIDPVYTFADLDLEFILRSIPASIPWLPHAWRDSFNAWIAGGEEDTEDFAVGRMIDAGQQHYSGKLPQPERITEEALAGLDIPVLAIIAGDSVVHDAEAAADVAERTLSHGTVLLYEGATHAVASQEPDRIAADLSAFLADQR